MKPGATTQTGSDETVDEFDTYQSCFDEIKMSNPDRIFSEYLGRKAFRMDDSVIKFGSGVDVPEAQTLQYIKESTTIPVPSATSDQPGVIVMDYVEGRTLEDCWTQLSEEEQQGIAEQMRDIVHQLRGLKGSYIGAVNRGPAVDLRKFRYTGGPFNSESEFNEFFLRTITSSTPFMYRSALQSKLRRDHDIVFTNADLSWRNILVKNGAIVALLDWETAGWYPEYWEYVKFCYSTCHEKEWHRFG